MKFLPELCVSAEGRTGYILVVIQIPIWDQRIFLKRFANVGGCDFKKEERTVGSPPLVEVGTLLSTSSFAYTDVDTLMSVLHMEERCVYSEEISFSQIASITFHLEFPQS